MSLPGTDRFWVTNHIANPVLRRLLRGPLGHRLGRRLAVLRYTGRRTGQPHELVVQYVRDGARLWIMPGQPDRKRWWRNLRDPAPVDVWVAGRAMQGTARTVLPIEDATAEGFATYHAAFPKSSDLDVTTLMIRIDLEDASTAGAGPA